LRVQPVNLATACIFEGLKCGIGHGEDFRSFAEIRQSMPVAKRCQNDPKTVVLPTFCAHAWRAHPIQMALL
jgi:hypothetical protein